MRVALGVSASVGPYVMPLAARRLRAERPDLRLRVREGVPRRLLRELAEGAHDAVLNQLPLPGDAFAHRVLGEERLYVMMATGHPLAAKAAVSPADLAGARLLSLGPDFTLTRDVERLARETGAQVSGDYEGSTMDSLRIACALGHDLAVVPEFYARSEAVRDPGVTVRGLAGRRFARRLGLAWRQSQGSPGFIAPLGDAIIAAMQAIRAAAPPPDAAPRDPGPAGDPA